MTGDEVLEFGQTPLKQMPNRVWRTYHGGALIDKWQKTTPRQDRDMPEEWKKRTT